MERHQNKIKQVVDLDYGGVNMLNNKPSSSRTSARGFSDELHSKYNILDLIN